MVDPVLANACKQAFYGVCATGERDLVKLLLERGLDPNIPGITYPADDEGDN